MFFLSIIIIIIIIHKKELYLLIPFVFVTIIAMIL